MNTNSVLIDAEHEAFLKQYEKDRLIPKGLKLAPRPVPKKRREYVLGFAFTDDRRHVVLIRKNKPEWQAGRLNGVGGHVEDFDMFPEDAMSREFQEEAGVLIPSIDWRRFCELKSDGYRIFCFRHIGPLTAAAQCGDKSPTDERVVGALVCNVLDPRTTKIEGAPLLPNLRWLIPMALSMDEERVQSFDIQEREAA